MLYPTCQYFLPQSKTYKKNNMQLKKWGTRCHSFLHCTKVKLIKLGFIDGWISDDFFILIYSSDDF